MSSAEPATDARSIHRLRPSKLVRFSSSLAVTAAAGIAFTSLSLLGELRWWGLIVGAVLLILASVGLRPLLKDLRMRLELGPEGVSVNGEPLLRWSEVVRVTYVRAKTTSAPVIAGITLHTAADLELTLGQDLTDWPVIQRTLARHFGPPQA